MAGRSLLTSLRGIGGSSHGLASLTLPTARASRSIARACPKSHPLRAFHNSSPTSATTTASGPPKPSHPATAEPPAPEPFDARNAAYLGEADSDDGFEAANEINPRAQPSLDLSHSAYLGEADSDDGFEAHREIHPPTQEPMDPTASAYLGEADGDDGFEGEKLVNPAKFEHGPIDPSPSGFHGETGHGDQ